MSSLMTTTNFVDFSLDITKNLKIFTMAAFKTWTDEYTKLVEKFTTDLKIEKRTRFEGAGSAAEKTEGGVSIQKRMYPGNIETTIQKTYAVEMPVTWEQRKYVVKDASFMNQLGQYNARSMKLIKEYDCANILNNGFTSGTGYDGAYYFSASHTWRSDATLYDNLLNSVDLGRDAVEDAFIEMTQATMEAGIPMTIMPRKIHIAYSNIFTLPELLKTVNDPESANNTYNVIKDFNIGSNLNHYFTDGDSYFIDSDTPTRGMYTSQPTKFDSYMDNPTLNLVERGMTAHSTMFYDQAGTYGSQGG
jgi:hypothetical protein